MYMQATDAKTWSHKVDALVLIQGIHSVEGGPATEFTIRKTAVVRSVLAHAAAVS